LNAEEIVRMDHPGMDDQLPHVRLSKFVHIPPGNASGLELSLAQLLSASLPAKISKSSSCMHRIYSRDP